MELFVDAVQSQQEEKVQQYLEDRAKTSVRGASEQLAAVTLANAVDTNGHTMLYTATKAGNETIVKQLLRFGAEVTKPNWTDDVHMRLTPLTIACTDGHVAITKLLLDNGADPSAGHHVCNAAAKGHVEILKLLVAHGASLRAWHDGQRPLTTAAQHGHLDTVLWLLEQDGGSLVNMEDEDEETPLICAAGGGHLPVVECLLDHGADINMTTTSGWHALSKALFNRHETVAEYIVLRHGFTKMDEPPPSNHKNPMMLATGNAAAKVVELLLQRGVDSESQNPSGETPLIVASRRGSTACIATLCQFGANVHAKDKRGNTPMLYACMHGLDEAVRLLVHHGVTLTDDQNERGETPLTVAATRRHFSTVECLLRLGVKADENEASTAAVARLLSDAIDADHFETAIFLLQHRASVNTFNPSSGEPPLWNAAARNAVHVAAALLQHGADPNDCRDRTAERRTPLHIAAAKGNVEMIKLLLQHGAAMNATTEGFEMTPLAVAAVRHQHHALQVLIALGADPSGSAFNNLTPLMAVADCSNEAVDTVQLLLGSGANINVERPNGWTALWYAVHNRCHLMVCTLLQHGARVHVEDDDGGTPLSCWRTAECVHELLYPFHMEEQGKPSFIL